MPKKRPAQSRQTIPAPLPADRGRCPACWTMRPVDESGLVISHQVRAGYAGQQPLITCPGGGQEPAGRVVHSGHMRRF